MQQRISTGRLRRQLCLVLLVTGCANQRSATTKQRSTTKQTAPTAQVGQTLLLTGADGLEVRVVELADKAQAIIIVSGTRSRLEGKALLYKRTDSWRTMWYTTQVDGRNFSALSREGKRGGGTRWRLRLPEDRTRLFDVSFDQQRSKALDPQPVLATHRAQLRDGSLAALQRLDAKAARDAARAALAAAGKHLARHCGKTPTLQIDWPTVSEQSLKTKDIGRYCGYALEALQRLCGKSAAVADFVRSTIARYRCRLGDSLAISLKGDTLVWTFATTGRSRAQRVAGQQLQALKHEQLTLRQHLILSQTQVCVDRNNARYFVLAPDESDYPGLAYGRRGTLQRVRSPRLIGRGWFFDPRQYNPRHHPRLRGYNLRYYSYLSVKKDKQRCQLVCGTRETELLLAPETDKRKLLLGAKYAEAKEGREPYALARDQRGTYYYVDRGTAKDRRRDFRLFIGPLGRLRPSKMKDIVSDSEGEIFSSRRGRLRLVVGKQRATWIRGKRHRQLLWVPVEDNYRLIYNTLGVYLGQQLGTPCDHY